MVKVGQRGESSRRSRYQGQISLLPRFSATNQYRECDVRVEIAVGMDGDTSHYSSQKNTTCDRCRKRKVNDLALPCDKPRDDHHPMLIVDLDCRRAGPRSNAWPNHPRSRARASVKDVTTWTNRARTSMSSSGRGGRRRESMRAVIAVIPGGSDEDNFWS